MPAAGEGPVQLDCLNLVYDGVDSYAELCEACGSLLGTSLTSLVRLGLLDRTGRGRYAITAAGCRHIGLPRSGTHHLRLIEGGGA